LCIGKSKNKTERKQIKTKRTRKTENKTKENCFVNLKDKKSSQWCNLHKLRCLHKPDDDAAVMVV
jgi:hypothetical protein